MYYARQEGSPLAQMMVEIPKALKRKREREVSKAKKQEKEKKEVEEGEENREEAADEDEVRKSKKRRTNSNDEEEEEKKENGKGKKRGSGRGTNQKKQPDPARLEQQKKEEEMINKITKLAAANEMQQPRGYDTFSLKHWLRNTGKMKPKDIPGRKKDLLQAIVHVLEDTKHTFRGWYT